MRKAIVWSRDHCPYCDEAKKVLRTFEIIVEERNISGDEWSKEQLLEDVPNARTVPQIILDGKYIGGYKELLAYLEEHNFFAGRNT